jgi:hypothetical protein
LVLFGVAAAGVAMILAAPLAARFVSSAGFGKQQKGAPFTIVDPLTDNLAVLVVVGSVGPADNQAVMINGVRECRPGVAQPVQPPHLAVFVDKRIQVILLERIADDLPLFLMAIAVPRLSFGRVPRSCILPFRHEKGRVALDGTPDQPTISPLLLTARVVLSEWFDSVQKTKAALIT